MDLERLPRWPCLPLRSERHDRGLRGQWRAAAWAQAVRAVGAARAHAAHAVAMEDMPALQLDAAVRERIEAQHAVDAWLPRVRQLGVGFLAAEAAGRRDCSLQLPDLRHRSYKKYLRTVIEKPELAVNTAHFREVGVLRARHVAFASINQFTAHFVPKSGGCGCRSVCEE